MSSASGFIRTLLARHHVWAKVMAIFCAVVTVFLIDQDISSVTEWEFKRIRVYSASGDDGAADNAIRIVVDADPRVWIGGLPKDLKVRISGPKNRREEFLRNPVIRIHVRQEQVPNGDRAGEPHPIKLDAQAFKTDIEGMSFVLLREFKVDVDEIITVPDVPLKLATLEGIPKNRIVDDEKTYIQPATATVTGPRHLFYQLGKDKPELTVKPMKTGSLRSGQSYDVVLADGGGAIKFADGNVTYQVHLELKSPPPVSIQLGSMKIYWSFTEDVRNQLARNEVTLKRTLDFDAVKVTVSGPPNALEPFRSNEGRDTLRSKIRIIVDANEAIGGTLNEKVEERIPLVVLGLPAGLEAELSTESILLTIRRTNSDNK